MKFFISKNQFFLGLFVVQTGSVFISFQTPLIEAASQDAWIVFIVCCVIQFIQLYLYERYYSYFKINKFLQWMYSAYWLLLVVTFLAYIQKSLSVWAFPLTPPSVIIGAVVLLSFYANISRPESVMNLGVLLLPLFPLIFIFLSLATPDLVWTNVFPMGNITLKEWGIGLKEAKFAFIGTELYLFYRTFVLKSEKIDVKSLMKFILTISTFYFITLVFILMFFSLEELKIIPEPLVYILKSQEVTFIERLDLFFIFIWMAWSIITVVYLIFTISMFMKKAITKTMTIKKVILHALLFVLPLIIIAQELFNITRDLLIYGHFLFSMIIPLFVIVINMWRGKNAEKA
ncbi:spore germination protein [Paenisporosarcina quisquiliarum]|uniref:Spore germination protein n=1 Tax=Paenisporosarcina quisquiliarum TaxID=365346 RepID=A0A9X3LDD8_9BACL|nr:GerAB/ArcD/ProY family transporter [Paenisporosarcina quisquiliarum]MCZ8535871.1 spore germination protein [Paenisporosarcina quisquiliarum]